MNVENINLEDLRNGKHRVFEHIFTLWYEPLCNYAGAVLRDSDEAEDMVQKVFYKLWDKRSEIFINTSIKSYLYRAVHNDCMNLIKRTKIKEEYKQYHKYVNTDHVEADILSNELQVQIKKAIKELPSQCQKAFQLSRAQQLSYAEISEEMGISVNTVENHIAKALKILRKSLSDYLPLLLITWLTKMN